MSDKLSQFNPLKDKGEVTEAGHERDWAGKTSGHPYAVYIIGTVAIFVFALIVLVLAINEGWVNTHR